MRLKWTFSFLAFCQRENFHFIKSKETRSTIQKFCQWGFAPCKVIQDSPGFWILHCGFRIACQWNLDSTFQSLACFWIPLAKSHDGSCSNLIPNSKAQDSGYHDLKFPTFQNHGETLRFHLNGNTIGFPQRCIFKFYIVTSNLSINKIFHREEDLFQLSLLRNTWGG